MVVSAFGCAKSGQPATESSPTAGSSSLTQVSPVESGASNGPSDILSPIQGTILRSWASAISWSRSSDSLLNFWESQSNSSGPYVFVYELPATGTIHELIFTPTNDPNTAATSVHVSTSTSSATDGYSDVGTYTRSTSNEKLDVSLPAPIRARWLKVSVEQRGSDTSFNGLQAIGDIDQRSPVGSLTGTWVLSQDPSLTDAPVDSLTASFPSSVDPTRLTTDHELVNITQHGNDLFGVTCSATAVTGVLIGIISGSTITWTNEAPDYPAGIVNTESDIIVGAREGQNTYVLARANGGSSCAGLMRPSGPGKQVMVLFDKDPGSYVPYQHQEMFQGYRFAPMPLPLFDVRRLAGFDTLVVADICNANVALTATQKQVITDWVYTGNKLIISDSDLCTSSDYSFLPYSFQTSNPGRRGAHGDHLMVVEPNALGSERNDPVHFVDTAGYVDNPGNQLGDANVVTTKDSHWCGHLFGTNVSGDNGYVQIYAPYGQGLIIYDGLDRDDVVVPQYSRILQLELDLPANALLPCSQSVNGDFSIAPSVEYAFTPGKAESARFQLQALTNHGYSGTVKLSAEGPTGVTWHAGLSTQQVSLGGKVAPFDFTVAIPQNVRPGRYVFTVVGTDERGKTARAFVTLSSLKTGLIAVRTLQRPTSPHIAKTLATKKRVTVYGVYFDFASDRIRPESAPVLKEIADALRANPAWKLTIEGHTDNVGGADYNLDLSKRRAAAVKRALVTDYHVQADRLNTVGYGFTRPKASNDTAEGRALNRRVELVRH